MRLNETELKVSPLLATPDEANQGHNEATLAWYVRVSGVPKRGCTGLISIARLGVNEANQGQMGPRFRPPSFREGGIPLALWERVRMRVKPQAHPAPIAAAYERDERK